MDPILETLDQYILSKRPDFAPDLQPGLDDAAISALEVKYQVTATGRTATVVPLAQWTKGR